MKQELFSEVYVNTRIILAIVSMSAALYLCSQARIFLWIPGQILLAVAIMQSFILLQKFGEGEEIKSCTFNSIGGHITSFFCLVPFNQWRVLNRPGEMLAIPIEKKLIPPFNVMAYSMKNYWNIKKLFRIFPDKKTRVNFVLSMLVMNCFFMLVMPNVPHFWRKFGIGYFLFLLLAERKLLREKN
ncbi:MAG: hypothetical protein WC635_12620 [Bacteriovorax sp.]